MVATIRVASRAESGVGVMGQRDARVLIMARLSVLLLLLVPSLPCDEAVGHVPLTSSLPTQPSLPRQSQPQVIRTSLCRGCCPSHCWWDAAAVTCRCPHRRAPHDSLAKYPHLLGMSLSSLLAQSSDSRQRPRADTPLAKNNIRRHVALQPFPSGRPASLVERSHAGHTPSVGTDSSVTYTPSTNQLAQPSQLERASHRQTNSGGEGVLRRTSDPGTRDYAVRFDASTSQQFHVFRPLHPSLQHSSALLGLTGRRWDEARRRLG